MQCSKCGATIDDADASCASCGTATSPPAERATSDVVAAQPYRDPASGAPLATWWQRAVALIVDWVVIGVPAGLVAVVILINGTTRVDTPYHYTVTTTSSGATALAYLVLAGAFFAYFTALTGGSRGQTVGKRAVGIAVQDAAGAGPIGYGRAAARYGMILGLGTLLLVPLLADYLSPLWSARRQAWHDTAARSIVVTVG
jgi:uncharacterized RDD family membrane protein YckC